MTTHEFLDDGWIDRFNRDIRATPRGVVALDDTRLRLTITDGPDGSRESLVLDVDDGRPLVVADGADRDVTAEVDLPYDVVRSMFLDGEMLAGLRACDGGGAVATGRRETLLYFLYHLFPGGPDGARQTAEGVRAYTAS
jgi:hypothetical protein